MKMIVLVLLLIFGFFANAEKGKGEAIQIYIENDTRRIGGPGSDNAYSSGVKLSYIFAENDVPNWATAIMNRSEKVKAAIEGSKTNFGFSLGQQIFTPNDIRRKDLIIDDRPYAAWLYAAFSMQFQNPAQSHALDFSVGLIGPEALGKPIQNGFHHAVGTYEAEGWEHQMGTEPTLQMAYQQRLRFLEIKFDELKYFDLVPFFGAGVGNVSIDAHAGGMARLGTPLNEDLGPARPSMANGDNFVNPVSSGKAKSGIYIFASGRGIAVGRNVFLDGNSFRGSHRVKKYPFIVETEFGVVGSYHQWNATWRFVTRSPEFEQRSVVNSFASVSLGYTY